MNRKREGGVASVVPGVGVPQIAARAAEAAGKAGQRRRDAVGGGIC